MLFTIVSVNTSGPDTPMSTSAPTAISSSVIFYVIVSFANVILNGFIPSCLPGQMTPLVSHWNMLSLLAPAF